MSDTPPPPQFGHPNPPPFPEPGWVPTGRTPAPRSVDPDDLRPKRRWLWISGAVAVLGVVAAVVVGVLGIVGISNSVDDFERVQRGSGSIRIDDPGEYVVYAEGDTSSVSLTITDPDGQPIETSRYQNEITYEFGGRSGTAALTFEARATGTYAVQTDADIAVGPSIADRLIFAIVLPLAIGGLFVTLGLVMMIVVLVRRSKSKQRIVYA